VRADFELGGGTIKIPPKNCSFGSFKKVDFLEGNIQLFGLFKDNFIFGIFCYTFCKKFWKTPTFTRRGVGKITGGGVGQIGVALTPP
jgi:hypothetical protein